MSENGNKFERDLLGDPIDPRKGLNGRPRHKATDELRARVAELHAQGMNQTDIGRAIGITEPTLRRHYPIELGSTSQAWRHWQPKEGQDDE